MSVYVCYICGDHQFPSYLTFKSHMETAHWKSTNEQNTNFPSCNPANYQLQPPSEGSWTGELAKWYIQKTLFQNDRGFPAWHPTFVNLFEACSLFLELYDTRNLQPFESDLLLTPENMETTFYTICDEIFRYDGRINPGRIVAVFVLAGKIARHPNLKREANTNIITNALSDYVDIVLVPWIKSHGDWV